MQYGVECFGAEWLNKIKCILNSLKLPLIGLGKS